MATNNPVRLGDMLVPAIWVPYFLEKSPITSVFHTSGVIRIDPGLDRLAQQGENQGGLLVNMPFYKPLSGESEIIDTNYEVSIDKITTSKDFAIIQHRQKGWGAEDIARIVSGSDPLRAIGDNIADFWRRDEERILLATAKGALAATGMSGSVANIYAASPATSVLDKNVLTASTFADAAQLLGDQKQRLKAIFMHSAVENELVKRDMIDFIPGSDGTLSIKLFRGLRVISGSDDLNPPETINGFPVYTSYIFADGAFGAGYDRRAAPVEGGTPNSTWPWELARVARKAESQLINRRRFILHPFGIKWTDSSRAALSPTNAELANAANWELVYERKNVGIVAIKSNITPV